jgi:hypothetical protein
MLTKQLMVQAIADRLVGFESTLKGRQFSGIYRKCWEALDAAGPGTKSADVLIEVLKANASEQWNEILGAILGAAPGSVMRYDRWKTWHRSNSRCSGGGRTGPPEEC